LNHEISSVKAAVDWINGNVFMLGLGEGNFLSKMQSHFYHFILSVTRQLFD